MIVSKTFDIRSQKKVYEIWSGDEESEKFLCIHRIS